MRCDPQGPPPHSSGGGRRHEVSGSSWSMYVGDKLMGCGGRWWEEAPPIGGPFVGEWPALSSEWSSGICREGEECVVRGCDGHVKFLLRW